jgi:hypothetical protein
MLAIDDGYGQVSAAVYDFDPSAAACDSTGKVVKYYKSTTKVVKNEDPSDSSFGWTETYYING